MQISGKYVCSFGLGLAMFLSQRSFGQTDDLKISVVLGEDRVPEHLPVAFEVVVRNESPSEVELYPYDIQRLPKLALSIRFESPLALPPAVPKVNDFGFPEIRIPPFKSVSVKGYLQNYLQHLTPGAYTIPYSFRWEYTLVTTPGTTVRRFAAAKGNLQFRIVKADLTLLNQYVSTRTAVLQESTDAGKTRMAADEIALIDDRTVLPALMILIDRGYEVEALQAGEKLPDSEALQIMAAVAGSSRNPPVVRKAIEEIEKRGSALPARNVRTLLDSNDKWLQIEALGYVERSGRQEFLKDVATLAQSSDHDVSAAAERARNKLKKGLGQP